MMLGAIKYVILKTTYKQPAIKETFNDRREDLWSKIWNSKQNVVE